MTKLNQSFAIVEGQSNEKESKLAAIQANSLKLSQQSDNLQQQVQIYAQ